MNNIKCSDCGLVNWSTSSECRRCGAFIGADYQNIPSRYSIDKDVRVEPLFTTGIKLLSAMLAVTTALCLAQQAFQPLSTDMAKEIAVFLALPALGLYVLAHIWLLIRIFEQSVGWGLASLIFPVALLMAVSRYWEKTKRSFVGQCICMATFLVGMAIGF
jgi:hypothetical protein